MITPNLAGLGRSPWGLCEEHAVGLLVASVADERCVGELVAAAYMQILEEVLASLTGSGVLAGIRARQRLKKDQDCPFCALDHPLPKVGDSRMHKLQTLLQASELFWTPFACPRCLDTNRGSLCREHLQSALPFAPLPSVRASLGGIGRRLIAYSRALQDDVPSGPGDEERAGLFAAIGWCAGWRALAAVWRSDLDDGADDGNG